MTADESGLPDLDPDEIHPADPQNSSALLAWAITTLINDVGVSEERQNALDRLLRDLRFPELTGPLAEELVDVFTVADPDPDWVPPTDEEVEEFKQDLERETQDEPPTEEEPTE